MSVLSISLVWLVLGASSLASPDPLTIPAPLQYLREVHTDVKKEGPVVFPNDGPPPPLRPLVVTARPPSAALTRPHFRPRKPQLLVRLAQYRPLYPAPPTNHQKEPPPPARLQSLHPQRPLDHSPQQDPGDEYAFSYSVRDQASGEDSFGHWERGRGGPGGADGAGGAKGAYRVRLPDGRVQTTSYTADHRGYRAQVTYHPDYTATHLYTDNDFTIDNHFHNGGDHYKLPNHNCKIADDFKFNDDHNHLNSDHDNYKFPLDNSLYKTNNDYKFDNHDYRVGDDYKFDSDVYKVGDHSQSDNHDDIKYNDIYKDNYGDNYKLDNQIYKDGNKLDDHDNTKFGNTFKHTNGDNYKFDTNDFKENNVYEPDNHDNIKFGGTFKHNNGENYKLDTNDFKENDVYKPDDHDNIKFGGTLKHNNGDNYKFDIKDLKENDVYKQDNHDNIKFGDTFKDDNSDNYNEVNDVIKGRDNYKFDNLDFKVGDNYKNNHDFKVGDNYKLENHDTGVEEGHSGADYSQELSSEGGHDYSLEQEPAIPHRAKFSQFSTGPNGGPGPDPLPSGSPSVDPLPSGSPSVDPLPTRYLVSSVARLRNGQPPQLSRSFIDRVNRYLTFT